MALTDTSLTSKEAACVLHQWGLEIPAAKVSPAGGTANAAAIVEAPEGRLFLKRRNPRYAREEWVRFDHALFAHLAAGGLPVPRGVASHSGLPWVIDGETIYELFEFIEGEQHRPGDPDQLRAAGETLGRIHRSASRFRPPVAKEWGRFHDPKDASRWLSELMEMAAGDALAEAGETLASALEEGRALTGRLSDETYWNLPRTIVQADYHPANLKFADGEIAGVFDWDWASDQPRMVDLADGLLFFCGRRDTPLVGGDIWSLTEAFDLDDERVAQFGGAYAGIVAPEPQELAALPDLMRARWLYSRADAARRKVEPERRVEFVARDLHRPLKEISRLEAKLIDGSILGA